MVMSCTLKSFAHMLTYLSLLVCIVMFIATTCISIHVFNKLKISGGAQLIFFYSVAIDDISTDAVNRD